MHSRVRLLILALMILVSTVLSQNTSASEIVSLSMPNGQVRGEVIKVTKSEVTLRDAAGKEQIIPLLILKPKEVYLCRSLALDAKDAKGQFELGEFCQKNGMEREAKDAFDIAVHLDASLGEKVAALTGKKAEPIKEVPKELAVPKKEDKKEDKKIAEDKKDSDKDKDIDDGYVIEVTGPDGKKMKVDARFMTHDENVPAKSPADFKKFCDDRLAELKKVIGGDWRYEETEHYVCFSNVPIQHHNTFKAYNEALYKLLCDVLKHKEGDPLWNNKCPIYYFNTYSQFQKFAVEIDHSPGGTQSGGYFSHMGRDCHVAIPFYDRMGEAPRLREAHNTLYHEGTHAFLQLTGKNVNINSWLHEGMAQFIEFWYDANNNPGRTDRIGTLRECFRSGDILDWASAKNRPMGGADRVGYAFAWSRIEFLYRCFPDKQKLPNMIKLIKDGQKDEDAIEKAFGFPLDKIEQVWENWVKENLKTNFKN